MSISNFHNSTFLMVKHIKVERRTSDLVLFDCKSNPLGTYECENCTFITNYKVAMHNHHKENCHRPKNVMRSFHCQDCNLQTRSIIVLLKHLCDAQHSDTVNWLECEHCTYQAKFKSTLKRHVSTVHGIGDDIKWFLCNNCSYKSKHKSNLKTHMMAKHMKPEAIKWHKCDQCQYQAKQESNLKKHVSTVHESGEAVKWYKCEQCSYQAKQKGNLKSHSIIHESGESIKWFDCNDPSCSFRTKHKSHWRKHLRTNHVKEEDIRWFKCEQCSFKTKWGHNLRQHVIKMH